MTKFKTNIAVLAVFSLFGTSSAFAQNIRTENYCAREDLVVLTGSNQVFLSFVHVPEFSLVSQNCLDKNTCVFDLYYAPFGEQKQIVVRDILGDNACAFIELTVEESDNPHDFRNGFVDETVWTKARKVTYSMRSEIEDGVSRVVTVNKEIFYSSVADMPLETGHGPGWDGVLISSGVSRVWFGEIIHRD